MVTTNATLTGFAQSCGVATPAHKLADIEADLSTELANIRPYENVLPTLGRLQSLGIKLAVCSNWATPYGARAKELLPGLDAYAGATRSVRSSPIQRSATEFDERSDKSCDQRSDQSYK